jgi:DNA repair protein RecO (recombination protein O)
VFVHKTSDALDVLTEAKLERRFRAAATDLERLYAGYYLVELTMALTDHADPQPALYDLLSAAIVGLDSGERPAAWVARYELRLLALIGHGVSLEHCTSCGRRIESAASYAFGIAGGGLICPRCRPGKKQVISIDPATRDALHVFSAAGDRGWRDDRWSGVAGPLRGLLNQLITHVLGHRPKLLPYLGIAKP